MRACTQRWARTHRHTRSYSLSPAWCLVKVGVVVVVMVVGVGVTGILDLQSPFNLKIQNSVVDGRIENGKVGMRQKKT